MKENGVIYVPDTMLAAAIVLAKGSMGRRDSWKSEEVERLMKAVQVQFEPVKVVKCKDLSKEYYELISWTTDLVKTMRNHILTLEDADVAKHLLKPKWVLGVIAPKKQ